MAVSLDSAAGARSDEEAARGRLAATGGAVREAETRRLGGGWGARRNAKRRGTRGPGVPPGAQRFVSLSCPAPRPHPPH